ncbi:extracellular solute-binding protein [Paenibacillus sonchi]|uniref:Extracellular solute-binding protein n=1 Tax=Paenibacillus sonchi TaxID=373687 RepID=A0A974SCV8_9BACL|nr:extracellular solute-binding protein [Paenibacillus sonchi]QQZ59665.1 extracellular solute-binding protein [Paenibacillus sonchi]
MKSTKSFPLLSVVLCSVLLIAGCGGGNNGAAPSAEPTKEPTATETAAASASPEAASTAAGSTVKPVSFTYYSNYDWDTTEEWGRDSTTKWIADTLKVKMTPVQSSGAAETKFSTMIASGSLPDVIMMDRGANVERLRQPGLLVPLDDYLDRYPNLKNNAGEATLNMLRSEDGKLYQFPNWYTSSPNGNGGWIINRKIYKELGSPKLETYDDLYAYLKLVKEKHPDVVPLEVGAKGRGLETMYGSFAENKPYLPKANPVGNTLQSIFEDQVFIENMQYASKLFREKLITQDMFTQTGDQISEKLKTGRVAVYVDGDVVNPGRGADTALRTTDPDAGYDIIWPIHKAGLDATKITPNNYNSLGWNVLVITKNAKDPEAIFSYLDWVTGEEGQRILNFGRQGLYWDEFDADGVPILNEAGLNTPQGDKDKERIGRFNWVGNTTFIDQTKAKMDAQLPADKQNWTTLAQQKVTWKTSKNFTEFVNLDPLPDSEEGTIATAVNDIYQEAFAKTLYAKSDDEVLSLLNKANEDAKKAGYEKLLKYQTEKWQDNLSKMK